MGSDGGGWPGSRHHGQLPEYITFPGKVHEAPVLEDFDGPRADHVQVLRRCAVLFQDRGPRWKELDEGRPGDGRYTITFEPIERMVLGEESRHVHRGSIARPVGGCEGSSRVQGG